MRISIHAKAKNSHMSDNLREYYETVFQPETSESKAKFPPLSGLSDELPASFHSLTDEQKWHIRNSIGFSFWNLSRSLQKFAKVAKEAMRHYRHKHVRRVR